MPITHACLQDGGLWSTLLSALLPASTSVMSVLLLSVCLSQVRSTVRAGSLSVLFTAVLLIARKGLSPSGCSVNSFWMNDHEHVYE